MLVCVLMVVAVFVLGFVVWRVPMPKGALIVVSALGGALVLWLVLVCWFVRLKP